MRRALAFVAAIALLLAAAGAGFWIATSLAPERLRAALETRLGELLATPVEIGEVRTALRYGAVLEATDVRAGSGEEGPALEVASLLARLDPAELVAGRLRVDWMLLDGAVLRLERDADGMRLAGAAPATAGPPADAPAPRGPLQRALDGLAELARSLDSGALATARIEVRDGRVVVLDRRLGRPDRPEAWGLEQLDARLGARWMPVGSRLTARAQLRVAGERRGRLVLRADSESEARVELGLEDLDLEALHALVAPGTTPALRGRAGGRLEWSAPPDEPPRLRADLEADDLFVGAGPRRSRWRGVRLEADLEAEAERLRIVSAQLSEADAALDATGSLGLPLAPGAPLDLRVALRPIPLRELALLAGRFSGGSAELRDQALGSIEAGRVRDATLELSAPLRRVPALLASPLTAREGELRLRARLAGAVVTLGDGERLDDLGGRIDFSGDRLELAGIEARLAGPAGPERELPRLDAQLRGLAHLEQSDDVQCLKPRAVPPLPGRAVLDRALAQRDPSQPPRWSSIAVEADWVLHPVLLCSLERVKATLGPAEAGFRVELEHGVWAGIPLRARGRYHAAPAERFELEAELGPLWEPVGPFPAGAPWARGRYRAEIARFGPWRTRQAAGAFRADAARLTLERTRLDLEPGGRLEGRFLLDFDDAETLPWRMQLQVPPLELSDLSVSMGADEPQLTGKLVGGVDLRGRIRPGTPSLSEAEGLFSLHARDGVIRQRLPAILAITMAGESLSPFPSRESIPFESFELVLDVEGGRALSRSVRLDGPTTRLLATGELGLVSPYPLEAVVGVLFFRQLDSVIQRLPLLNRMLLGSDENLVNAYFALEGPWNQPRARLVPIKSLASGPASIVLEGFPAFVRGGLSRLRSILPGGGSEESGPGARADS